jgi:hypothetical protein
VKSSSILLVSKENSKERDLLKDRILTSSRKGLYLASGLDLSFAKGVTSGLGKSDSIDPEDLSELLGHVLYQEVSYYCKDHGSLLFSLDLTHILLDFIKGLRFSCKDCGRSLSYDQNKTPYSEGQSLFYALQIPSRFRSYGEISTWMEQIPSSIVYMETGDRYRLYDGIFKVVLDESDAQEKKFAFLDETLSRSSIKTFLDNLEIPLDEKTLFLSLDQGSTWYPDTMSCCTTCAGLDKVPPYSFWKQYLMEAKSGELSSHDQVDVFCVKTDYSETGFLSVPMILRMPFNALKSNLEALRKGGVCLADTGFEKAVQILDRIGFGELHLLSGMDSCTVYDTALLSFVKSYVHFVNAPYFLFASYFSGLPVEYRKKILYELNGMSGVRSSFLIMDDVLAFTSEEIQDVRLISRGEIKYQKEKASKKNIKNIAYKKEIHRHSGKIISISGNGSLRDAFLNEVRGVSQKSSSKKNAGSIFIFDFTRERRSYHPLACVGSYSGILKLFRMLYVQHPLSRMRGYTENHFSFFSTAGRCSVCGGSGRISNTDTLDITNCYQCNGGRVLPDLDSIRIDQVSFLDVLTMPMSRLMEHFYDRVLFKSFFDAMKELEVLSLSLGTPLSSLHQSEHKRIFLYSLERRLKKKGQLVYLREFFRGVSFYEAEKIIPFIKKSIYEGALVLLDDSSEYGACMSDENHIIR